MVNLIASPVVSMPHGQSLAKILIFQFFLCFRLHNQAIRISTILKYHASTSVEGEIVIPKRIPRGPTDILKVWVLVFL